MHPLVHQTLWLTRLSYNCAHLRLTKESLTIEYLRIIFFVMEKKNVEGKFLEKEKILLWRRKTMEKVKEENIWREKMSPWRDKQHTRKDLDFFGWKFFGRENFLGKTPFMYKHVNIYAKGYCSYQPSKVHWLSSPIFPCLPCFESRQLPINEYLFLSVFFLVGEGAVEVNMPLMRTMHSEYCVAIYHVLLRIGV